MKPLTKENYGAFTVNEVKATNNGKYPPILVALELKFKYDKESGRYIDEIDYLLFLTYFPALKHEKLEVKLPPLDTYTAKEMKALSERVENGEEIILDFENLNIGLYFNNRTKEWFITASASDVTVDAIV